MPPQIEAPWRFLGDLDLADENQLRQVMILLHNEINPNDGINPCMYPCSIPTRLQKLAIVRILDETEKSELLKEMVVWFNANYNKNSKAILGAASILQEHATWFVRNPKMYAVEYTAAKEKWTRFVAPGRCELFDDVNGGQEDRKDSIMSIDGILNTSGGPSSSPSTSMPRKAKMNVVYREKKYWSDDEMPTETEKSSSSDESVNIFRQTIIPGPKRTRSGAYSR